MKVRIGVGTGSLSGSAYTEVVDRLEKLDVDSLWLSDQLTARAVDPFVGMTHALARTSRLKVGTSVAVLPGRNPVMVAKQLASLAALAPRRVLPAFGLGPAQISDRSAFPVPEGKRGAVFDEALVVVRRLLTEPRVNFAGTFFQLEGIGLAERPDRPLDIWLGGAVPAALRRVGRLGDGWLASFQTPAQAAAGIQAINNAAAAAGRGLDQEHFGVSIQLAFEEVPDRLAAALRRRAPDADPAELVPVGWSAARSLIGKYVEAGVSKFVVYPSLASGDSWDAFLDGFAEYLVPLET